MYKYISLNIAALVMCLGRESTNCSDLAFTQPILKRGARHLRAQSSVLYCSYQHLAVFFLSTWLRASLSEHQCGAGERERERRRRTDRDAGCFSDRVRSADATCDAAALRADGSTLSALRPLGGDAGEPPLRPVRVALTQPAAPRVTHVLPFSILYYLYLILVLSWLVPANSLCHLSLCTVGVILYSIMYLFSVCSWLPLVCAVLEDCSGRVAQVPDLPAHHRHQVALGIVSGEMEWSAASASRELLQVAVQSGPLQHCP